jgi:hypothetical protein
MSPRGRKNLPVGSSTSSWAGAPAILDDTASASRIGAFNARSLAEADRAPYPRRHRRPRLARSNHRVDPSVRPRFAVSLFFLPPAHRGGRVIDTDALRILLLSREPSDGQKRNQDNEDYPNINAHQSSPLMGKYN